MKSKGEFNFSKLNYNVQSIYFRARAFIASSHPQWLLRSKKKKKKQNKIRLFKVEVSKFRQSHSRQGHSLSCRKSKRGRRRPLTHVVNLYTESVTRPFLFTYFCTRVPSKSLKEIKRAFNLKKGSKQNNKKKETRNIPSRKVINFQ